MKESRVYTIEACREVLTELGYGFTVAANGIQAKRILNKDIVQEVYFQITSHCDIIAHYQVSSKKVKKWFEERYQIKRDNITGGQLGYITPLQTWKNWHIGNSDIAKLQFKKEVQEQMVNYLIPFFDTFNNINSVILKLCEYGGRWTEYEKGYWFAPVSFVLAYGNVEQAQQMFDKLLMENPSFKKNIIKYKTSENIINIFGVSSFQGEVEARIAFDNGIKSNL